MDEDQLVKVFAAVGDPTRLALLRFVLDREHCVSQCTQHTGLSQGAVSKQLANLAEAGLVNRRRASRRIYYRVSHPDVFGRMLADAGALVAAPGRA